MGIGNHREYLEAKDLWRKILPLGPHINSQYEAARAAGDTDAMNELAARAAKWKKDIELLHVWWLEYERNNPGATFTPWLRDGQFYEGEDENGNQVYTPCHHPSQTKVWNWYQRMIRGEAPRCCFVSGGNQSGKTAIGSRIMWDALMSGPGRKYWGFATNYELSVLNQQAKMWDVRFWSEVSPKQREYNEIDGFGSKNPQLVVRRPGWKRPSILTFKSYMAGVQASESGTLHGIWGDEPPTMDILSTWYNRVSRHKGFILITATFVDLDEVYESIIESGMWEIIELPFLDNPAQTQEEFDRLYALLPEHERQARLFGRPVHRAGRLFPEFRREPPYFVPASQAPRRQELRLVEAIDFHGGRDIAHLLCGVDAAGRVWALDELAYSGDLPDFCRRVWELRLNRAISQTEWEDLIRTRFRLRPIDQHARPQFTLFNTHMNLIAHGLGTGNRIHIPSLLAQHGVPTIPYKSDPAQRATTLRQAIIGSFVPGTGRNDGPGTIAKNVPQVIITDRCPLAAQQIQRALWDTFATESARRRHGVHKDQPMPRDMDFVDDLGSIVESLPRRFVSQEERHRRRGHGIIRGGPGPFARKRPSGARVI